MKLMICLCLSLPPPGTLSDEEVPAFPRNRLLGEFERQGSLMLANDLIYFYPELFASIVVSVQDEIAVIALINQDSDEESARRLLSERRIRATNLHFMRIPHNTMWTRDYGPFVVEREYGPPAVVDMIYDAVGRGDDDLIPRMFANAVKLPVVLSPLVLEGGNLLVNGSGLCITTTKLLVQNYQIDEKAIRTELAKLFHIKTVFFMEPLSGEHTGHVDMFATFTSEDTVVIGSCDPASDPVNAALLDRNATRLSTIRTPRGPLKVMRLPLPGKGGGIWRTFTNVVYANSVLLLPVYPTWDKKQRPAARALFKQLLPRHRIVEIDANKIALSEGALHCATMNLGSYRPPNRKLQASGELRPESQPLPRSCSTGRIINFR